MASDKFYPLTLNHLLKLILRQYEHQNQIFGIPRKLFFSPHLADPLRFERFGQIMETPIGVAAGPHTQLAQNIVAAWLTGARFIELKTIQTLDDLVVSKPCIDMQDEGYNCEWSQELKIHDSFNQYLDAWILIHILKDILNYGDLVNPGVIFNMSVGYNLEGILKNNVQWFFKKMNDASEELEKKLDGIKGFYPHISNIKISPQISNNVTLSTMHGCPPDEIEKIGHYLLNEKKLHTAIKLNPTLIGKETLRNILTQSGFETYVPDSAFEHDLKYIDAIDIIKNLSKTAKENSLQFSIKLTNTLESENHKDVFPPNEKMMYMSGRALHPISINLAAKLQNDFDGKLDISFCGGADAFNVSDIVSCGLSPVTVCSDILKPGGYGRLGQYIEELRHSFSVCNASNIDDYIIKRSRGQAIETNKCQLINLNAYAERVLSSESYRKVSLHEPNIKTARPLGFFDCIHAPCEDTCPTNQDIPQYNYYTSQCDLSSAGDVILQTNPFPQTTGMICDHLCQTKCTRINYDHPVLIREIKRYIAETAITNQVSKSPKRLFAKNQKKVSIIGAGPSGLSCAYFLALAGFRVEVYESKPKPGGMISGVIPAFRLTDRAIENDIRRVEELGVTVHYNFEISADNFQRIKMQSDYVYIAVGAQNASILNIEGIGARGVVDPLKFLEDVKKGNTADYGNRIAIIGGGNTAMDAARTAYRLTSYNGKVFVVYRRTIKQMPADMGEIRAVMNEGVEIIELSSPERINTRHGKLFSLTCSRMKLGEKDASGRQSPVKIPSSEFDLEVDTIIPAIGQELAFDLGENKLLNSSPGHYETQIPNVFIGGDALRGASTAINAIGDGRKVAQIIIDREGVIFNTKPENKRNAKDYSWHMYQRTRKIMPSKVSEIPLSSRKNFNLVAATLFEDDVIEEAKRCLLCDEFCSICSTVCPNLANHTYKVKPSRYSIQRAVKKEDGSITIEEIDTFSVAQPYQVLNIANFCNECGNCTTFCPSSGAPYKDKPRVFLTKNSFDEADNGFFCERINNELKLYCKNNGIISVLTDSKQVFSFKTDGVEAILDGKTLAIKNVEFKNDKVIEFTSQQATIMKVILEGIKELLVYE
jgi:putative selenate reductase